MRTSGIMGGLLRRAAESKRPAGRPPWLHIRRGCDRSSRTPAALVLCRGVGSFGGGSGFSATPGNKKKIRGRGGQKAKGPPAPSQPAQARRQRECQVIASVRGRWPPVCPRGSRDGLGRRGRQRPRAGPALARAWNHQRHSWAPQRRLPAPAGNGKPGSSWASIRFSGGRISVVHGGHKADDRLVGQDG